MKKLILIITMIASIIDLNAQTEKVFNYSDSVFHEQSIHYLDLVFDYNGGRVIKDSLGLIELEKLTNFINKHPNLSFDIEHHTDHRGTERFNLRLSQFRADNLVNELVFNYKIDSVRIKPIGYGESKPLVDWEYVKQMNLQNEEECIREGVYYVNRRTQLRIVKIKE